MPLNNKQTNKKVSTLKLNFLVSVSVSLFNGISAFVGYLMPKHPPEKFSSVII